MITQPTRVAALYVDARGPYPKMPGVDCWDVKRDATKYGGPWPVVAHPACGPWGKLRHMYKGGEGGPELAIKALEQVRKFGGVLEHPADSKLWWHDPTLNEHIGRFGCHADRFGGRCTWVEQVEWGHAARKRTWLYTVGVPRGAFTAPPFPGRKPTHYIGGGRQTHGTRQGGAIPTGIKAACAQMRRRTPPLFAEYLVSLALYVEARA